MDALSVPVFVLWFGSFLLVLVRLILALPECRRRKSVAPLKKPGLILLLLFLLYIPLGIFFGWAA